MKEKITGYSKQPTAGKLKKSVICYLSSVYSRRGFTLIEALATLSIMAVVGLVLADLLTKGFKGNAKTQLLGDIKQNGQTALNTIDQTIRFSSAVVCPKPTTTPGSSTSQILVVKDAGGKLIRLSLNPAPNTSSNGFIARDVVAYDPADQSSQNLCTAAIPANADRLTDDKNTSLLTVGASPYFKVTSNPGSKDIVEVAFDLGPSFSSSKNFEGQLGGQTVQFKTSIQIK